MTLLLLLACSASQSPALPSPAPALVLPEPVPAWPSAEAPLHPFGPIAGGDLKVYVDAGHGTAGNEGARNARCGLEQEVNLRVAERLAVALEEAGFQTKLSRTDHAGPSYSRRLAEAEAWDADVFLSVHTDARGAAEAWWPEPGLRCWRNADDSVGFAVLVSDEDAGELAEARRDLARSIAQHAGMVGLPLYDGRDYTGLYEHGATPGVFLDRRGLMFLRRPSMPSVILETHNGLHVNEAERWAEEDTVDAFASAVARALSRSRTD